MAAGYSWAVLPSPVERDPVLFPYLVEPCPVVPCWRADTPSVAAR
ncbi:hypothetical protein SAMN05660350_02516 [Geodermatophilus obscurus]|uniref:Uncharacterized protein n=1 Tax=Geodermatophilus obscurus TaxID=1861 RepID=A0A1M7U347_9ACTN|nr:hypothetical protein SAMN05660350_02516 [Geodermatophilus obscurus]